MSKIAATPTFGPKIHLDIGCYVPTCLFTNDRICIDIQRLTADIIAVAVASGVL